MLEPGRPCENRSSAELSAIEKQAIPWLTMILIGGLVFTVGNNLSYSAVRDWSTSFVTTADVIAEGSIQRRVGFLLLGLWGAVTIIVAQPRYKLRLNGLLPWLGVGFLFWAALSLVWAADSPLTLRRLVILGLVVVAISAVLRQFSLRQTILFVTLASLTYAMIGVVAEIAYGTFQPFSGQYRFSGTMHPNHQGMNLATLILGATCLSRMRMTGRRLFVVIAAVGFLLLVLTKSRTTTGATMLAFAWFVGVRSSPLRLAAMVMSAGAVGLLALFFIQNEMLSTPWQLILMGRDEVGADLTLTFSGRTGLWEYLWTFVVERPVTGYGYNSFLSPQRASEMPALIAWGLSETHSLYLEVLLGTGGVGLLMFVGALVGGLGRAFGRATRLRDPAYAFVAAQIVFILVNGLMTAAVIFPGPKFFSFLVVAYVLFRDPERDATEGERVLNAQSGQFAAASQRGGPTRPGWPPGLERQIPPPHLRR